MSVRLLGPSGIHGPSVCPKSLVPFPRASPPLRLNYSSQLFLKEAAATFWCKTKTKKERHSKAKWRRGLSFSASPRPNTWVSPRDFPEGSREPETTATGIYAQDAGGEWAQLSGSATEMAAMRGDNQSAETEGKKESHLVRRRRWAFVGRVCVSTFSLQEQKTICLSTLLAGT